MNGLTPDVDDVFQSPPPRRTVTARAIRQVLLACPEEPGVYVLADMAAQAVEERDSFRDLLFAALDHAQHLSLRNDRLEHEKLERLRAGRRE